MKKYTAVGAKVRSMMLGLTPLVEPLSIDEAFMDISGTESLHRASPATTLAGLARQVEEELSITVSIGLSYNKFLAKIASDLDKPRGFAVIGRSEARAFLAGKPVGLLWGVGTAMRKRLERDGIRLIGELTVVASSSIISAKASTPARRQNRSTLRWTASIASASGGIGIEGARAFGRLELRILFPMVSFSLLGLQHPEPNGSRRATPTSTFQHRPGHPRRALPTQTFHPPSHPREATSARKSYIGTYGSPNRTGTSSDHRLAKNQYRRACKCTLLAPSLALTSLHRLI